SWSHCLAASWASRPSLGLLSGPPGRRRPAAPPRAPASAPGPGGPSRPSAPCATLDAGAEATPPRGGAARGCPPAAWARAPPPRASLRATPGRVRRGDTPDQRRPRRLTSGGPGAPGTWSALGALPPEAQWLREPEETAKRLTETLRQNPQRPCAPLKTR